MTNLIYVWYVTPSHRDNRISYHTYHHLSIPFLQCYSSVTQTHLIVTIMLQRPLITNPFQLSNYYHLLPVNPTRVSAITMLSQRFNPCLPTYRSFTPYNIQNTFSFSFSKNLQSLGAVSIPSLIHK
ncbi:hypothetical protein ICK_06381 [Bacillus cereus BAG1X2-2]|nr:hypothetical protein ICK_06381 [Bacillus cereus BAG1X2-2]EOP00292.1 hypothetical protein ICO_06248 [Bacillus cereus BAG2O-1]